jgi:hypothetical protein
MELAGEGFVGQRLRALGSSGGKMRANRGRLVPSGEVWIWRRMDVYVEISLG